jgi:hypothetical protein
MALQQQALINQLPDISLAASVMSHDAVRWCGI